MNSKAVALDYITYRLSRGQIGWGNGQDVNIKPTAVEVAMRRLGDEFEERFKSTFADMITKLNINPGNVRRTFYVIVGETFADGINWGRIVVLFAFAGIFAIHCCNNNMLDKVDNLVEWVSTYMDTNLFNWMEAHNSWDGFLKFHQRVLPLHEESSWYSWETVGLCLLDTVAICLFLGLSVLTLVTSRPHKS